MPANPSNGMINCSLGDDGALSYEDTCIATCNTGYILTGDAIRTCQNDGMLNGTNAVCSRGNMICMYNFWCLFKPFLVTCLSLADPSNGAITCSVGDDGVLSYEDTCTTICDTGYEIQTGDAMRTCQSDGTWSGADSQCSRGSIQSALLINHIMFLVFCPLLTNPVNGMITCSLGDDGVSSYEDTCTFTCNTGYVLTSSDTRTCQSDGSWSGSQPLCLGMKLKLIIRKEVEFR